MPGHGNNHKQENKKPIGQPIHTCHVVFNDNMITNTWQNLRSAW